MQRSSRKIKETVSNNVLPAIVLCTCYYRRSWQSLPIGNVNILDIVDDSDGGVDINTYVFISSNEVLNMEALQKSVEV